MTLPGPSKVSPLIRFFRYTFLIAGIIYGATRYKVLHLKEANRKEEKERLKAERDAKIAMEKRIASEKDIAQIVAIFSEEPKPKFKVEEQSYENAEKEDSKACLPGQNKNKVEQLISDEDSTASPDNQCQMFSKPIDFSDHPTIRNPNSERKYTLTPLPSKEPDRDVEAEGNNEYFVETFKNGVPYADPQNDQYDFIPKDNK
ncbi:uncharacterized protein [Leptinotarsa decemlineata]|uniref:uncharacterized protein n=1 Tax=Leptinotarsa decemlineata TaxID=7539 RepID=UPI000C253F6F|nr:uncharacterized protein LOC111506114 [Leptinotarsa decemlineata]